MQNKNLINNKEKSTQSDSVKKGISSIFEWVETVIFAFCFVVFLFTFVFKIVTVSGPSMNYTLYNGQKLVISSMFYSPQRGDIVVVDTPKFNEPIIKRIIALEGDTVDIDFEKWIITVTTEEGEVIIYEDEEYVNRQSGNMTDSSILKYPLKVNDGEIFVMGDNRCHSTDSRAKGCFKESEIIGKAIFRIWPMEKIGTLY